MKVSTSFGTVKIVMLKGEKGDKFQFEDYTPEELESLRGEQGEPFTYDDFTEKQLEDLRSEVASAYYRKVEATYYTIGDNTETIVIPIEGYKDSDMLFVDVEGLALTEGVDYTIEGNSIVLTEPITHHYTAVNFRALCAYAITAEDYELLKAEEAHRAYETVAAMLADENLTNGMIVRTLGFHSAGDGGAALYLISSTGTANGMDVLACENGLYALLVISSDYVMPEMFGAFGDGLHDDDQFIQAAVNKSSNIRLSNTYLLQSPISLNDENKIIGTQECLIILPSNTGAFSCIGNKNVSIKNINIIGAGESVGDKSENIIVFDTVENGVIDGVKITDINSNNVVRVYNSKNIAVSNCHIENYNKIGILVYCECNNVRVENNTLINNTETVSAYGIQINCDNDYPYPTNVVVSGNYINGCVYWDGIMAHGGEDIIIEKNICENVRQGIDCANLYKNVSSAAKNIVITDNILISTSDNSAGNSIGNAGIYLGMDDNALTENVTISNNMIIGFRLSTTPGNRAAINIRNCKNVVISNNVIKDCYDAFSFMASYMYNENIEICSNCIEDVSNNAIQFRSGSFKNLVIHDNVFKNQPTAVKYFINAATSGGLFFISSREYNNILENFTTVESGLTLRKVFYFEKQNAIVSSPYVFYKIGDVVKNKTPSVGAAFGWVCTQSGIGCETQWSAHANLNNGSTVYYGTHVYLCLIGGTTGDVAPTTSDNTVFTDGSAVLVYVGEKDFVFTPIATL